MYELTVRESFGAAHRLQAYPGKCANLHGHNWRVVVAVTGEKLDDIGILIDFKKLKQILHAILEEFDHKYLNDLPEFQNQNPSAENIAATIYHKLAENSYIQEKQCHIKYVEIWETEASSARYYEEI